MNKDTARKLIISRITEIDRLLPEYQKELEYWQEKVDTAKGEHIKYTNWISELKQERKDLVSDLGE